MHALGVVCTLCPGASPGARNISVQGLFHNGRGSRLDPVDIYAWIMQPSRIGSGYTGNQFPELPLVDEDAYR